MTVMMFWSSVLCYLWLNTCLVTSWCQSLQLRKLCLRSHGVPRKSEAAMAKQYRSLCLLAIVVLGDRSEIAHYFFNHFFLCQTLRATVSVLVAANGNKIVSSQKTIESSGQGFYYFCKSYGIFPTLTQENSCRRVAQHVRWDTCNSWRCTWRRDVSTADDLIVYVLSCAGKFVMIRPPASLLALFSSLFPLQATRKLLTPPPLILPQKRRARTLSRRSQVLIPN